MKQQNNTLIIYLVIAKKQKAIAWFLFCVFYFSFLPIVKAGNFINDGYNNFHSPYSSVRNYKFINSGKNNKVFINNATNIVSNPNTTDKRNIDLKPAIANQFKNPAKTAIGGPGQPEMATFKSIGADNMVSPFTGDFSYNIPLLDVGGYPVNIFYNAGITMEQEATWAGLGWNINPGTINRTMRGLPDDFNGEDKVTKEQSISTDLTVGVKATKSSEIVGITKSLSVSGSKSYGITWNNKRGVGLSLGKSVTFSILKEMSHTNKDQKTIKDEVKLDLTSSLNISSQDGFSKNIGFGAQLTNTETKTKYGVGTSIGYNSMQGLTDLNLSGELSDNRHKLSNFYHGNSSYSFARSSYIPSIRFSTTSYNALLAVKFGKEKQVFFKNWDLEGFLSETYIAKKQKRQIKPAYGFMYYHKGQNTDDALMDFNRLNDGIYSTKTPAISLPVYTYDVFNITGEGTGGTFRGYRGSVGYVKDNRTESKSGKGSIALDLGVKKKVHVGVTIGGAYSKTTVKQWEQNNALKDNVRFNQSHADYEGFYFKNPAEAAIIDEDFYNAVGKDKLIRPVLNPDGPVINGLTTVYSSTPTLAPQYEVFNDELKWEADLPVTGNLQKKNNARDKRTQVISYLSAEEASWPGVGLDKNIWAYTENEFMPGTCKSTTYKKPLLRFASSGPRKNHHISEVTVLENDSKRYIYGLPVYTTLQKEVSFTEVKYAADDKQEIRYDPGTLNPAGFMEGGHNSIDNDQGKEKFFQSQKIENFAHAFLLTAILSPDYVDVIGDGITDDDLGTAVKFNYSCANITGVDRYEDYKWRFPACTNPAEPKASFNEGLKTDFTDNKANYTYGAKELWYLHSLESKNMVATFRVSKRRDGLQAAGENGGVNSNVCQRKLDRIDLYTKADFAKKSATYTPKPIKTVHFEYDYSLCGNVLTNDGLPVDKNGNLVVSTSPDNVNSKKGKLTLKRIWFTYNGSSRKSGEYVFKYASSKVIVENGQNVTINTNPDYNTAQNDRWGNYKPVAGNNPNNIPNADYPFATQSKDRANAYASAWNLEKILLPSGSVINVNYESDNYGYVQDRRATVATKILGFGPSTSLSTNTNDLKKIYNNFTVSPNCALWDYRYVFFQVDAPLTGTAAAVKEKIKNKYLNGINQLLLKLWIKVPSDWKGNGYEPIYVYAGIEDYNIVPGQTDKFYIKLNSTKHGGSPVVQTMVDFMRRTLASKVYPGYDNGGQNAVKQVAKAVYGLVDQVSKASVGFEYQLKVYNRCNEVDLDRSFARLNAPAVIKYGGGHRVKSIIIADNWNKISKVVTNGVDNEVEKESFYGQEYNYEKKETIGTDELTITSGVATYEPGVGNEENPFREVLQYDEKQPLGPTRYENVETPIAETFFPASMVGYSKVTIKSIHNKSNKNIKSGVGKQVKEFYTARDFPLISDFTSFDNHSQRAFKPDPISKIFQFKNKDLLTLTQGFRVVLNDMNGKPKADYSYPEGDDITVINSTEYFYRKTKIGENKYRLDNIVPVIENASGTVVNKLVGKDVEVMNDSREHYSFTYAGQIPINMEFFMVGNYPVVIPTLFRSLFKDENLYRSFTTLKVVNEFGILEKVVNNDKGSIVSTESMVYDAETGGVLVSKTNNEFKKPVYNFNYPAHWAQTGMEPAYKNIDVTYDHILFRNGRLEGNTVNMDLFESGDELYVLDHSIEGPLEVDGCNGSNGCIRLTPGKEHRIWAVDLRKDPTNNQAAAEYIFIDRYGVPYNGADVYFRIIRSGHRNLVSASLGSVVSQNNPIVNQQLVINNNANIINASAVLLKEKWKAQDIFYTEEVTTNQTLLAPVKKAKFYAIESYTRLHTDNIPQNANFCEYVNSHINSSLFEKNTHLITAFHKQGSNPAQSFDFQTWIRYDFSSIPTDAVFKSANLSLFSDKAVHNGITYPYLLHNSANPNNDYNTPGQNNAGFTISPLTGKWLPENDYGWSVYAKLFADNAGVFKQGINGANNKDFILSSVNGQTVDDRVDLSSILPDMIKYSRDPARNWTTAFRINLRNKCRLSQPGPGISAYRYCFNTGIEGVANPRSSFIELEYADCSEAYGLPGNPEVPPPGQEVLPCANTAVTVKLCKSVFTKQFMNPYIQGIIGIWRPWRSYVFYGERRENDLNTNPANNTTNITKDGVIKEFEPYWVVNTSKNKIEPGTSTKWVWNSEVLQYNRKGAQLEEHDPLNRYNAAIYGYQETLPIATVNNSRLRQSAFDGFEDYSYKDDPCEPYCKPAKVHFKTGVTLTKLTTDESHTGRYSYKLDASQSAKTFAVDLPVSADNANQDPLIKVDVTKTTYNEIIVNPSGIGLTSRYYKSRCWNPADLNKQSISPQLYFFFTRVSGDGGNEPFIFGGSSNQVSSKYTGKFQVEKSGKYLFHLGKRDFAKVILDGEVFLIGGLKRRNLECWGPIWNGTDVEKDLVAGQIYNIEVLYANKQSPQGNLGLYWSHPCENPNTMDLVPSKYFYPENITPPTPTTGSGICYSPQKIQVTANATIDGFDLIPDNNKKMIAGIWIKKGGQDCKCNNYTGISLNITNGGQVIGTLQPKSKIIEGWQLFEGEFNVPFNTSLLKFEATADNGTVFYLDDLRFHPFNANMKSFVFDPQTLRLASELDENNYASFYEYDDEGTLVRVKKETKDGIKTITETRSAIQGKIKELQ
jgi:hypothetical protein